MMPGDQAYERDGDAGFVKVDTRTPAHELPPGVCADAVNKRFEDGRAWPRFNVEAPPWGIAGLDNALPAGAQWVSQEGSDWQYYTLLLEEGRTYTLTRGNLATMTSGFLLVSGSFPFIRVPDGETYAGRFVAPGLPVYLWQEGSDTDITAKITSAKRRTPLGFGRFDDPDRAGRDNLILLTDDERTDAGEDGGHGRAWRVLGGNQPVEIPLNGHDVWGPARLVQCNGGLALLRQGQERHYFAAAAMNKTSGQIQLNCAPAWKNGERVLFVILPGGLVLGTKPPATDTFYWVKVIAGDLAELYTDVDLAAGHKLDWAEQVTGRFYLERAAVAPGFYGNGAPPLLMQPDPTVGTAFQTGFVEAPPHVTVTGIAATLVTAPNHRLIPGDKIKLYHTGTPTVYYANPQNDDVLSVHTTVDLALAGQTPQSPSFTTGDYLVKDAASGQAMPPAREGCWTKNNRLVLVNQKNQLGISDPLDPLHFTPYSATLTIDGDSDPIQAVVELGMDALLLCKTNRLQLLDNFSQGPGAWVRRGVTGEYGIFAPLSAIAVGKDVWGLSRKGVISIRQTETGEFQGVALPMSQDIQKYIEQLDWRSAAGACAALWNNRYFLAVPVRGQPGGGNNAVLVYNLLNGGWEGIWTGAALNVYAWARHVVAGEERLCFVNYAGQVCLLGPGWTDAGLPIADVLTTRTYCDGSQDPKLWLRGRLILDQNNGAVTVTASAPGYNDQQQVLARSYNATKGLYYGMADYNPASGQYDAPGREDYSLTAAEVLSGPLDVHQSITENLRMRVNGWGVQLVIAGSRGSVRVVGVELEYVASRKTASRES